jgi:hypothetical protein
VIVRRAPTLSGRSERTAVKKKRASEKCFMVHAVAIAWGRSKAMEAGWRVETRARAMGACERGTIPT